MREYIASNRKLIHIIDLKKTCNALAKASLFLENVTAEGGKILVVGTKRAAQALVEEMGRKIEMPYVVERWLGGTLTNHTTVRSRLSRLEEIETMEKTGEIERFSKKMISSLMREKRKLIRNLDGIRTLNKMPRALLIIDPGKEMIAVKEARKLRIPVVALIDTDSDPDLIDIPIPGNDDAMRSIQIIIGELEAAIDRGIKKFIANGARIIEDPNDMPTPEEAMASMKKKEPKGRKGGGQKRGGRGGGRDNRRNDKPAEAAPAPAAAAAAKGAPAAVKETPAAPKAEAAPAAPKAEETPKAPKAEAAPAAVKETPAAPKAEATPAAVKETPAAPKAEAAPAAVKETPKAEASEKAVSDDKTQTETATE